MASTRLLSISQYLAPYMSGTEEAQMTKQLAQDFQSLGYEVRIFMPRYGAINERRNQLHEVIRLSGININIHDADHPLIIKVASLQPSRTQVYFIDNDDYFQKSADDVDESGSNRADNDERLIFFTRGTAETARKLRWDPQYILCSGWVSTLAPLYLRKVYADDPAFKSSKLVYVIDGTKFDGSLNPAFIQKLKSDGVKESDLRFLKGKDIDTELMHKFAVKYCDGVIIQTPDVSQDMLDFIKSKRVACLPFEKAKEGGEAYSEFLKSLK
ncbi:MAG: glycogen/starch synthase [Muribaculum sp.]|nr:glycogen/starch synthase [Muribaculum sp.]